MRNRNAQIEELLKQIASGDTASMGVLYDLIKTDLFAYALSRVGNKPDADDITQDTFLQIYRHAKQYVPQGKPMAWVITIENNLIRRFFHTRA
ncbi:MAG: RNA polymerase sigma factor, partial [Eubacteriales bacterium]